MTVVNTNSLNKHIAVCCLFLHVKLSAVVFLNVYMLIHCMCYVRRDLVSVICRIQSELCADFSVCYVQDLVCHMQGL